MNASMMQQPLLISSLLTHAERHHGDREIVSRRVEGDIHRQTYRDMGRRARVYYEANHTVDAVMRQFERLFVDAARRRVTARAA